MEIQEMVTKGKYAKMWKRTRKKLYYVNVRMGNPGQQVRNYLEEASYTCDAERCFIIRGTRGEEWVISQRRLQEAYMQTDRRPLYGTTILNKIKNSGVRGIKIAARPDEDWGYFAFHLDIGTYSNVPIKTGWGDVLIANKSGVDHGYGDYLVCKAGAKGEPDFSDMWVVNGCVFPETYDMRSAKG